MLCRLLGYLQMREICHMKSDRNAPDLHSLVQISALHAEQDAELLLVVHLAAGVSIGGGLLVHERSGSKSNGSKTDVTD